MLYVGGDSELRRPPCGRTGQWVGGEVLATRVVWRAAGAADDQATMQAVDLDGVAARIAITKAE